MAEPKLTTRQRREMLAMIGPNPLGAQGAGAFDPSLRVPVPVGQQLVIGPDGNVTNPTPAAGTPAPATAAPAAETPAPVPNIPVLQRPVNAYTIGAPIADDRTDRFGREMPGAQTFARTAFAASENAKKLLEDYKKANPTDKAGIAQREAAANQAAQFASQSNAWMALPSSTRARLITEGQVAADQTSAMERGRQQINEMRQDPNLFGVLRDYNETGVLRGGAGPGTATTDAGGVISAPDATGTRQLTSPYGTGSSRMLTPNEFANRPEAMINGQPASKFFEDAALRQGRDITVGGVQYSGAGTQLAPGRTSYTPYDQKQVEGRRAFWEDEAKRNKEKGTPPIR